MYRHLLVPLDGSQLSGDTVEQALAFARDAAARVTFLHAQADYAATTDGALMHAMAPAAFLEGAAGNARALLAKAMAAARAAQIECDAIAVVSDRPHDAIVRVANEKGCDLIFMASHGRRGWRGSLRGSVTQKVLQRSTLPVLVVAVESNLQLSDEQRAVATIKDEHRSLAAVIHGLQQALRDAKDGGHPPNFAVLRAMLFYIDAFPERLHHPKEQAYLFVKLRERTGDCNALLDALVQEHAEGSALLARLQEALNDFERGEPGTDAAFSAAIDAFANAQWRHMSAEETLVLPAAHLHLTANDWAEIAQAFHANHDPRFGADADQSFADLASKLLNIAATAR